MRRISPFVLAALATALVACDDPTSPAADSLGPSDTVGGDEEREPRRLANNRLANNRLANNKLANNALTASPGGLAAIALAPLHSDEYSGEGGRTIAPGEGPADKVGTSVRALLRHVLVDGEAREVMTYIAGCALEDTQSFVWTSPFSLYESETFHGALGLCPEWGWAEPTPDCLELVSACVLSRVNAFGIRVELSLRGEPAPRFEPSHAVPTVTKNGDDLTIASFERCAGTQYGPFRNCGWEPAEVGVCVPGYSVTVGAGAGATGCGGAIGSSVGDTMLRVCEGLRGCDAADTTWYNDDRCGLKPSVTFTCPSSGLFAVMKASYSSATPALVSAPASSWGTGFYPADEMWAFTIREAAFYGNLFDWTALHAAFDVQVINPNLILGKGVQVNGPIFGNTFACFSDQWEYGFAMASHRICGGPSADENCAATVVGSCGWREAPPWPYQLCAVDDGFERLGDGDYQECLDPHGRTWQNPVTTFLAEKCDAVPDWCE